MVAACTWAVGSRLFSAFFEELSRLDQEMSKDRISEVISQAGNLVAQALAYGGCTWALNSRAFSAIFAELYTLVDEVMTTLS
jgi:predicted Co/Zn/Cd cation transporter (cation efflux family)